MTSTLLDQPLIQKRDDLFKNMSDSYAQSIKEQVHKSCKEVITQINYVNVDCDPPLKKGSKENVCTLCISQFYPAILTNSAEENQKYEDIINLYEDGLCDSLCSCGLSKINLDNFLNVDASCKIDPKSLDQDAIATNIAKNLEKLTKSTVSKADVTNVVNKTIVDIAQDISQVISTTEVVELKGHGNMSGVTIKDVSNITFKALATYDSSISFMNQLVDNLMDQIKQEVDKKVVENIGAAFEKSKTYFIGAGIILGVSIVLIIILLIAKASVKKSQPT